MKQKWYCEICNMSGEVQYEYCKFWFTMLSLIGKDHTKTSPNCLGNANKIQTLEDGSLSFVDKNNVAVIHIYSE